MQIRPTGNCFTNSHKGHHEVRSVQFGTEMTAKIMHISCVEFDFIEAFTITLPGKYGEGRICKKNTKTTTTTKKTQQVCYNVPMQFSMSTLIYILMHALPCNLQIECMVTADPLSHTRV